MAMALSSSEVNASMGKIVACPTAGSCGILPAVILSAGKQLELDEEALIKGLFAAIVLKNVLGLVCDPLAGLVEIPCTKRNAQGAITGLLLFLRNDGSPVIYFLNLCECMFLKWQ